MTLKPLPYQAEGARYLSGRPRALLADEMGLGKTPQAIIGADLLGAQTITVLCPGMARGSWCEEFPRFSQFERRVTVLWSADDVVPRDGVVIASYSLARVERVAKALRERAGDLLICDEAHYLKDPKSLQTKAVLGHRCNLKNCIAATHTATWALTGTPAPNHPGELFSLFRLQEWDGTKSAFEELFCATEEQHLRLGQRVVIRKKITGARNAPLLREWLQFYMLRRTEADVGAQRPPLLVDTITVEPDSGAELPRMEAATELELLRAADTGDWRAVEVPHIATALRMFGVAKAKGAAKLALASAGATEKVIVFAKHRAVMEILKAELAPLNPVAFEGGMTPQAKDAARIAFQDDPNVRAVVAQITVAKEALTLTAATHVYLVEPSWVPDDNRQAIKRAHRHGQTRPVFAHFVSLVNSADQRVARVLAHKAQMQKEFLS